MDVYPGLADTSWHDPLGFVPNDSEHRLRHLGILDDPLGAAQTLLFLSHHGLVSELRGLLPSSELHSLHLSSELCVHHLLGTLGFETTHGDIRHEDLSCSGASDFCFFEECRQTERCP